jgi:hypothetical protein
MAVNWSQIQALYEPTLETHWARCRDELALDCPVEAAHDALVGLARTVAMERASGRNQLADHAAAAVRARSSRWSKAWPEIVEFWVEHGTWLRPPVLVTGEVTGSRFQYGLLVGFTRLGNLLGLLDREEVPGIEAAPGVDRALRSPMNASPSIAAVRARPDGAAMPGPVAAG